MNIKSSNVLETSIDISSMARQMDGNDHSLHLSLRSIGAKVSYEIMPSPSKLLFCHDEQQFYRLSSTSKIYRNYTCKASGCKCRVHIQNNECYIGNDMAHNHERRMDVYQNLCALNEIKRILRSKGNKTWPKLVFDDVVKR